MPDQKVATFEVDGATYELQFEFNALVEAEEVTGQNLLDAMDRLIDGSMTAGQLRGLLYAMICPYRGFPEKPADQVKAMGQLVRIDTRGPIYGALGEAFALAVSREYAQQYRAAVRVEDAAPQAAEDPGGTE